MESSHYTVVAKIWMTSFVLLGTATLYDIYNA